MIRSGPCDRRAQQRPQLRLEHFLERQAEAEAAQAERRSRGLGAVRQSQLRLGDVEGADRDPAPGHRFEQPPVDGVLRVFVEAGRAGARQQELRAIEPDALGAALARPRGFVRQLDVGFDPDRASRPAVTAGRPPDSSSDRS